jgi:hypothetical protein
VKDGINPGELDITLAFYNDGLVEDQNGAEVPVNLVDGKITVMGKLVQDPLNIVPVAPKTYGDPSFQLTTIGGSGNGAVTFELVYGPATVTPDGVVTITGAGNIVVRATKAGDTNYDPITSPDLTIVVNGSALTHDVTFNIDGTITTVVVNDGDKVTRPTDPKKEADEFDDWNLGEAKFDFNTPITGDITLTAKWNKLTPPVTSIKIVDALGNPMPSMCSVTRNGTLQLYVAINGGTVVSDIAVNWTVSDPSFAIVDANGKVAILNKAGMVVLNVTEPNSGCSDAVILRIS